MYKSTLTFFYFILFTISVLSQTVYNYDNSITEDDSWENENNWTPSYPGYTIDEEDTVIIKGNVDIGRGNGSFILNGKIINKGNIEMTIFGGSFIINGAFENTKDAKFKNDGFFRVSENGSIVNYGNLTLENELDNFGSLTNEGTIDNNDATFKNKGNFINNGIYNDYYRFQNWNTTTNNNIWIQHRNSDLHNLENGTLINNNEINIDKIGNIRNCGRVINNGSFIDGYVKNNFFCNPNANTTTTTPNIEVRPYLDYFPKQGDDLVFNDIKGENYFRKFVVRNATLNNKLIINVSSDFQAELSDSFEFMTISDELNGEFSDTEFPIFNGNLTFKLRIEYITDLGYDLYLDVVENSTLSTDNFYLKKENKSFIIYNNHNSLSVQNLTSNQTNGQIYGISGNFIQSHVIDNNNNNIPISTLSNGIYFLIIDGKSYKFVK